MEAMQNATQPAWIKRGLLTEIKRASPESTGPALNFMVRMRGLEPPRCHHHRLLRPARLPVPPHPQIMARPLCEWGCRVSRRAVLLMFEWKLSVVFQTIVTK